MDTTDKPEAELPAQPKQRIIQPADRLRIHTMEWQDVMDSLQAGITDFKRMPLMSMAFGAIITAFGAFFVFGLAFLEQAWMIIPVGVGFPLVAPFLAAGLYEMSRRYERGESFTWGQIASVIFNQQRREFGWMAFVVLFVFWIWVYQTRLLLALFLQWSSFSGIGEFITIVTSTSNGLMFIGVGTIVGAILSTVLFSITVIAMPLLLHREIDFVSAMVLSVRTVLQSPKVMLAWGALIAAIIFASMIPAFLGLIVTLPILGHATWAIYRRAILEREPS